MKTFFAAVVASGVALSAGSFAMANNHSGDKSPTIVERNANGKATKVNIDGKTYDVCVTKGQDSCINPREAGLNWGNRALDYWHGKPASEMD